jgi:hypothetical protein
MQMLSAIRQMAGGNPEAFAQRLMQNNPQFANFVRQNQGKTLQQIATENGIDPNMLNGLGL